jgi:hypothetical protein
MLRDLGIEEWLFDIDKEPAENIMNALFEIHDSYTTALKKVSSAQSIILKRQEETMAIVRKTVLS